MKNYQQLLNRKVNVDFAGETINVCTIVSIVATSQRNPVRGAIHFCHLKWEKTTLDLPEHWEIDETALAELLAGKSTFTGKNGILNFVLQDTTLKAPIS